MFERNGRRALPPGTTRHVMDSTSPFQILISLMEEGPPLGWKGLYFPYIIGAIICLSLKRYSSRRLQQFFDTYLPSIHFDFLVCLGVHRPSRRAFAQNKVISAFRIRNGLLRASSPIVTQTNQGPIAMQLDIGPCSRRDNVLKLPYHRSFATPVVFHLLTH